MFDGTEWLMDSLVNRKVYSHHKVRTSLHDRTLDSMFPVVQTSGEAAPTPRSKEIKESICRLATVLELRADVLKLRHSGSLHLRRCLYRSIWLLSSHRNYGEAHICRNRRFEPLLVIDSVRDETVPGESFHTRVRICHVAFSRIRNKLFSARNSSINWVCDNLAISIASSLTLLHRCGN